MSSSFQSVENGTAAGPCRRRRVFGREGLLGRDGEGVGRFGDRILTGDLLIQGVFGFSAGVRLVGRLVEFVRGEAVDPGRDLVWRGSERRRGMHKAPAGEVLDEL